MLLFFSFMSTKRDTTQVRGTGEDPRRNNVTSACADTTTETRRPRTVPFIPSPAQREGVGEPKRAGGRAS